MKYMSGVGFKSIRVHRNAYYFAIIFSLSSPLLLTEHAANGIVDGSAFEVNIENEDLLVVCSRYRYNHKFGNFTSPFGRLRQITVLNCVLHENLESSEFVKGPIATVKR